MHLFCNFWVKCRLPQNTQKTIEVEGDVTVLSQVLSQYLSPVTTNGRRVLHSTQQSNTQRQEESQTRKRITVRRNQNMSTRLSL